jgi:hypothetical protein
VLLKKGNTDKKTTYSLLLSCQSFIEDLEKNDYGLLEIL